MRSLWNKEEARQFENSPLDMRVYTSRLLGKNADLVLHGGGNTSVKITEKNLFGEEEDILYVKGSGWDLATIEKEGFAPVRMDTLLRMARLKELSDPDMVKHQRAAMTDPYAPNPSIEAILHAIIPFRYVDHTHADAVVTISNTPRGKDRIREIYGDRILIVDYVMPGFILAKHIYEQTKELDWHSIEGMVLLNHGVFTFHDEARVSYENMIRLVTEAEEYLAQKNVVLQDNFRPEPVDLTELASLRKEVSGMRGGACLVKINASSNAVAYSNMPELTDIASRGPVTPDHTIRTKCTGAVLSPTPKEGLSRFKEEYETYFETYKGAGTIMLDPAPRWAIWPGKGSLSIGRSPGETAIIEDISEHTMKAIRQAETLDQWKALPKEELFKMEYWELEQAKLKKAGKPRLMQGKIALVTGAAGGIGKACAERLVSEGAVVVAIDLHPGVHTVFQQREVLSIACDLTDSEATRKAVEQAVHHFGGLDLLVSNAGIFPRSMTLEEIDSELWDASIRTNLNSHQNLLKLCIPYLELGIHPAIVVIGSKNVPAPGPGAAAYSVAKAGLTQLSRVAAMELGPKGIRVNVIHPNAVYDTALWTEEILESRAASYGLTVEQYKANNILRVEVTSRDVAELACQMLGPAFSKTTGAQVPVDGGNDRII